LDARDDENEAARLKRRLEREREIRQQAETIAERTLRELYEKNRELEQIREHLQRLSDLDPLTGIPNRRSFQLRFAGELERARRYERPLSMLIVDLDFFKQVNDTYGHAAGDVVLCNIADALQRACRGTDFVARFGGEEFVVALPETVTESGRQFAERLRSTIEELRVALGDGRELRITISLGLATFPTHASTEDGLFAAADAALYEAKKSGRNRVRLAATEI
jgi:diguanylate cyclase (GGDEF)-like protein